MRGHRGQASVEVLALLPVLVMLVLVALQVMAMMAAAGAAQDDARAKAMAAGAHGTASGNTTVVTGTAPVPVLAGLGWQVPDRAMRVGVRLP